MKKKERKQPDARLEPDPEGVRREEPRPPPGEDERGVEPRPRETRSESHGRGAERPPFPEEGP